MRRYEPSASTMACAMTKPVGFSYLAISGDRTDDGVLIYSGRSSQMKHAMGVSMAVETLWLIVASASASASAFVCASAAASSHRS